MKAGENLRNKQMRGVGAGTALIARAIKSTGLASIMSLLKGM